MPTYLTIHGPFLVSDAPPQTAGADPSIVAPSGRRWDSWPHPLDVEVHVYDEDYLEPQPQE